MRRPHTIEATQYLLRNLGSLALEDRLHITKDELKTVIAEQTNMKLMM